MDANIYQIQAMRTENKSLTKEEKLTVAALGLCGESGEVADLLKKGIGQGHTLDEEHLKKELGDVCWYIALMATALDTTMSDVMRLNIEKLKARYPEGFDPQKSLHRKEGDI